VNAFHSPDTEAIMTDNHALMSSTCPEIERIVVCSTTYVTEQTCNTFLPPLDGGPVYKKGEYGWFVSVNTEFDPEDAPELRALLDHCLHVLKVDWLCLDCDGGELPGFPTHDW
jgi:hypothetical protein